MDLSNFGIEKELSRVEVKKEKDELEIFNRVYSYLEDRRERVLTGKINCIPWGFPRLERELPGIEQKKMYGITANQKVK